MTQPQPVRLAAAVAIGSLLVALAPAVAHAKGADAASLTHQTTTVEAEPGHDAVASRHFSRLADATRIYHMAFGDPVNSMVADLPTAKLGDAVVVDWRFPVYGAGRADGFHVVRQIVYPWATGGPVTHVAPGQPLLDGVTVGGWSSTDAHVLGYLADVGLDLTGVEPKGAATREPIEHPIVTEPSKVDPVVDAVAVEAEIGTSVGRQTGAATPSGVDLATGAFVAIGAAMAAAVALLARRRRIHG